MESVSKKDVKRYFRDVCEALAYLHSQNIMHRDIKVNLIWFSPRTCFSTRLQMKLNYVILGSLLFWEREKLCVALMNICLQRWYKIVLTTIKSTFGRLEYFCFNWFQVVPRSKAKSLKKSLKKWRQKYISVKDLVYFCLCRIGRYKFNKDDLTSYSK